ncbi:MAG: hypothetical protein V7K68_09830, partial [Nostoc sp.]|uniref:hypothetical protein n=1 Tax=Nostoc sp. TaxID=1180 RepID=UPI002FF850DC
PMQETLIEFLVFQKILYFSAALTIFLILVPFALSPCHELSAKNLGTTSSLLPKYPQNANHYATQYGSVKAKTLCQSKFF